MLVFIRVAVAAAEAAREKPIVAADPALLGRLVAGRIFMQHADILPRQVAAEDLQAPIFSVGAEAQVIGAGRQIAKIGHALQHIVGIHHPEIIGRRYFAGERQRLRPVGAEIAPGPIHHLAGNAVPGEEAADHFLSSVARARVDNDVVAKYKARPRPTPRR